MTSVIIETNYVYIHYEQPFFPTIKDHDTSVNNFRKHGTFFDGNNKRGLIVRPSGYDKTNFVINLIEEPNGLRIENLYIYSKSLYKPQYEYLRIPFKPLKKNGFFESENEENIISAQEI